MLFPEEEHMRAGRTLGFTPSACGSLVRFLRSSFLRRYLRFLSIINRNASAKTLQEFEIPHLFASLGCGSQVQSETWMMYSSNTLIKSIRKPK